MSDRDDLAYARAVRFLDTVLTPLANVMVRCVWPAFLLSCLALLVIALAGGVR